MATENKRLNVNPITWSTADKTFVPASGEIWYYTESSGSVFHLIGDGSSTVQELRDGAYITQVDNLGLSSGRTAFQELTSGTLSTSGWYTIAEWDAPSFQVSSGKLLLNWSGSSGSTGTSSIEYSARDSNLSKANIIISFTDADSFGFNMYRLAGSSTINSGYKLQAYKESSADTVLVAQIQNISSSSTGFQLVTPYLDDTPTLPDGVTVATFIEAGAELSLGGSGSTYPSPVFITKVDDDSIRICAVWGGTPKQGTAIEFVYNGTVQVFGGGVGIALDATYTEGAPIFVGNTVSFTLTKVSAFTAVSANYTLGLRSTTGAKLLLS